jgi:30S ribosomal protein S31
MGKGDKKTTKGKRVLGSYGNTRKRAKKNTVIVSSKPATPKTEATAEKPVAKKPAAKKTAAKKPAAKKPAAKAEE